MEETEDVTLEEAMANYNHTKNAYLASAQSGVEMVVALSNFQNAKEALIITLSRNQEQTKKINEKINEIKEDFETTQKLFIEIITNQPHLRF